MLRRFAFFALAAVVSGVMLVSVSSGQVAPPTPPSLTADVLPWSKQTSATFQFSSPGATSYSCRLDGGAAETCPPAAYTGLSQGSHVFQVVAVSADGESGPSTFAWTIDTTNPGLPSNVVAEATSAAGAIVSFTASDNLDPAPTLACGAHPSGSTFPLGDTTVTCTATDAAGNTNTGSFTVTVRDTTPPTLAPHIDVIRQQQSAAGALVKYLRPVASDAVDPSPTVNCNPDTGTVFPIGETVATCTATDDSGGVSAPTSFKVIVQQGAVPPQPGITSNVPSLTKRSSVTFELAFESGATLACRLDGPLGPGDFTPCSGGTQTYSGLVDGAYLFTVQVTNRVGNVSQSTYAWTVDLTRPARVSRLSARARFRMVTLSWTKPIDVDYDHVRIWRKRAATKAWKRLADRVSAVSLTDRTVSNHLRYLYRIRSFDDAGNVSGSMQVSAWPTSILWPAYNATVHSPPVVDWRPVPNASYYNMQLWRDGRKILSVWPFGSGYRLPASWTFQGKRRMLSGDPVTVYVWAGYGPKAAAHYGPLWGHTKFAVG